jgi:hypothetical protein
LLPYFWELSLGWYMNTVKIRGADLMEKTKYYVSVQNKSIFRDQGQAAYELEIVANDDEVEKLRLLLDSWGETDHATYFRSMIPGLPYHHDNENDTYDYYLQHIYKMIYDLGSVETQEHISAIAENLNHMGHRHE